MLLRKTAQRSSPKLTRLIYEMRKDLEATFSSFAEIRSQVGGTGYPTQQILDRAAARGEVNLARVTPRRICRKHLR